MMTIKARQYVGAGFPPGEGERLADWLVNQGLPAWNELLIDLSDCPPALLISAFFNAFLQRISEVCPERLQEAKTIAWKARFPFQEKNIAGWVASFKAYR